MQHISSGLFATLLKFNPKVMPYCAFLLQKMQSLVLIWMPFRWSGRAAAAATRKPLILKCRRSFIPLSASIQTGPGLHCCCQIAQTAFISLLNHPSILYLIQVCTLYNPASAYPLLLLPSAVYTTKCMFENRTVHYLS